MTNNSQQIVYGNFAGSFTSFGVNAVAIQEFQNRINTLTLYFVYLGKLSFSSTFLDLADQTQVLHHSSHHGSVSLHSRTRESE